MDVFEAIRTAWAVRRFTDEPVTDEQIRRCLKAAVQGPSGGNIQPWQFLVVTDPGVRRELAAVYRRAYDRYEAALLAARKPYRDAAAEDDFQRIRRSARHLGEHLDDAPVLVLFLMPAISMTLTDAESDLDVGTPYASVYPAVQNFILAARALGIGTTLTTVYRIYQGEVRAICGVPDGYEIVALVPMGRPRGGFGEGKRRPLEAVTHWNRFGNKE